MALKACPWVFESYEQFIDTTNPEKILRNYLERVSNDQVGNDYLIFEGNLKVDGKAAKTQNAYCKFHVDCEVEFQARIASNSEKGNLGHGEDSKFVMISQFGEHNGNIDPYRARLHYARKFAYLKTEEAKGNIKSDKTVIFESFLLGSAVVCFTDV